MAAGNNIKAMRECVREAFDRLGGADWLISFAQANHENARVFVSLVGRLIPTELTGKNGSPLRIIVEKAGETIEGELIDGAFQPLLDKPRDHLNS